MHKTIKAISPESPLANTIVAPGDTLRSINSNAVGDVLDYRFHSSDSRLMLEFTGNGGNIKLVQLNKPEGADLGLEFGSPLMDAQRSCENKCIFCFIDQLPKGMRKTLYYKDDDVRLSFLQGNYVTLTNLAESDIERIISLRISPINVSVHTLNPSLRQFMLGGGGERSGEAGQGGQPVKDGQDYLQRLAGAGITLNCQIVCCPGINDKKELESTIKGLMELGESINSVSVVPVGLTKHREGLYPLRPFKKKSAAKTVKLVGRYADICIGQRGKAVFYCADELYMLAGRRLPPDGYYGGYPQLENGVGMMRLLVTEFRDALKELGAPAVPPCASLATGALAAPYLTKLLYDALGKYGTIKCRVYPIKNTFFGESVTVSGLVTGNDIIGQLRGKELCGRLLIPRNMLRSGGDVFLDDLTVQDVSNALGVPVRAVGQSGHELLKALTAEEDDA